MHLRILLTILTAIFFLSIRAQGKPEWVVFTGAQMTTVKYRIDNQKQPNGFKAGVMGGAALKVQVDNNIYFFPAIYYSKKGYTVDFNRFSSPPGQAAKNNNTNIHTVEIAPLVQIDLSKKDAHPFVRFGPAIDFAFGGTEQFDTAGGRVKRPMIFSFGDYGRITASLNIHIGYEFKSGLMIFGHYAHGMGNMNNSDGGPFIVHRIAGISIGWRFIRDPLVMDTRVRE
jgi:hypothetical protein